LQLDKGLVSYAINEVVVLAFLFFLGSYFKVKLDETAFLIPVEGMLETSTIANSSIFK
jgi:hypothetical protein